MISDQLMRDVESELQQPTGRWTAEVFPPHLNGVLISRDCGILYRLHDGVGLRSVETKRPFFRLLTLRLHRSQLFFRKVTTCALNTLSSSFALTSKSLDAGVSAIVYLVILSLLTRQIERTHSSASLSRLSVWTFYTQAIVDAMSFAGHITFAILANGRPSLALVAPAFIACVLFSLEAVCRIWHSSVVLINPRSNMRSLSTRFKLPRMGH